MITFNVTTLNGQALAHPLCADFGETGGTIGRAPENTLVLIDPDRKISRTHATVSFRDGTYTLRDQGSVVPVLVNGRPLGNGIESALAGGDEIRIAGYTMHVAGDATPAQTAPAATVAASAAAAPAASAPAAAAPAASAPAASAPAASAPAAAEPAAAEPAAAPLPDAMPEPVLSWAGDAPVAPGEGIRTIVLSTPEPTAARTAATMLPAQPAVPAPIAAAFPPAAAPAPAATAATHDELLRALLAGAGLRDVEIPGGLTPQLMNQLGSLLHEATRGLIDLLAARANAKRQARADMTVIVSKDNNPLKFSPNVETALAQLLVPRGRGFMPPLRAVGDAYEDLSMHQQGFMAGMRSALALILSRFDPHELEQRLSDHSMVNSILPTTRKAKLWDMFGQLYGEISKEAASDFHTLFGEEFLRAYQAHVGKPPERGEPTPRK